MDIFTLNFYILKIVGLIIIDLLAIGLAGTIITKLVAFFGEITRK